MKPRFYICLSFIMLVSLGAAFGFAAQETSHPAGVLTGRIVDEDGRPMKSVEVQALVQGYENGRRQMLARGNTATTNDRGEFRLFWLEPGAYYIAADPVPAASAAPYQLRLGYVPANPDASYVRTYFPGTSDAAKAQTVDVGKGEVDVHAIQAATLTTHLIKGQVVNPKIEQLNLYLLLVTMRSLSDPFGPSFQSTLPQPGRDFQFRAGLTPGQYRLTVIMPARDGTYAGSAVVSVDRTDPETVEIPISRVLSVEGQVESAGNPGSLTVTVHPDAASGAGVTLSSPVRSTGKFILAPIMRERYSIRVGGLQDDAYLARVQINGKDMLPTEVDFPAEPDAANLVLTVNPDGGRVSGAGERPESTVVLAPDVRTRTDLFKTARTNAKGEFEIRGIAPGNYTLFVLKDAAAGAWEDAEFMKRFEGSGRRVVITSGARITLDSR